MKVKDIMHKNIYPIPQVVSLKDVITIFLKNGISCSPVVDENSKVVGIIHIDDLVEIFLPRYKELTMDYALLEDYGLLEKIFESQSQLIEEYKMFCVYDIMRKDFLTVSENAPLLEAASICETTKQDILIVIDTIGKFSGIIERVDIILRILQGGL